MTRNFRLGRGGAPGLIRFRAADPASTDPYFVRAPLSSDLFMDPNAATDGDGTEANPFNAFTAERVQSMSAGQHFVIKDGTFDWASLTNLPSGTESARCRIVAYPGHTPIGLCHPATTGGFDPHFGFGAPGAGASYWDLVGLSFEVPGRAGIVFGARQWSLTELALQHIRLIDCSAITSLAASDNGGCFVFDGGAEHVEVVRLNGSAAGATGGSGTNRAIVWADYQRYIKIIGSLLDCAGVLALPYYFKHSNAQTAGEVDRVVRNNIMLDATRGMLLCGRYFNVRNNALRGVYLETGDQGGADVGRGYGTYEHNTFFAEDISGSVRGHIGLTVQATGGESENNVFGDNVIAGPGELHDNPYGAADFGTVSSFNAYRSGSAIRRNSSTYTVSGYRTAFADREASSVQGTISFVNARPGSTPSDWALASGSTGENAASDGSDCGVDVTKLLTVSA